MSMLLSALEIVFNVMKNRILACNSEIKEQGSHTTVIVAVDKCANIFALSMLSLCHVLCGLEVHLAINPPLKMP